MRKVIERRLGCYTTTPEQDEVLLQSGLTGRKQMAVQVRLGEKMILKKALDELDSAPMTSGAQDETPSHGNSTAKRRQQSHPNDGNKRSKLS